MGYSCSALAHDSLSRTLNKANNLPLNNYSYSNTWEHNGKKYFFERGKENRDGSITGTVFVFLSENTCRKAGSLKIESNGNILRWPGMPNKNKKDFNNFKK